MSLKGHKRTSQDVRAMSALPPKADIVRLSAFAHTHYSLAQESRVESRIALRGNCPLSGCQTSKNVALTCNDAFATLHCVPITHAHNTVRQCETSWGNLSLLKALEHVVCLHRHTAALFF